MRGVTWVGLGVLTALLLSGSDQPGRAQPETDLPYDLEDRLQQVERKLEVLDGLLTPAPARPPKPARARQPKPRPRRDRPSMVPWPAPPGERLEPEETPVVRPAPRPPARLVWTWDLVDRWQGFRALAEGD